MGVMFTRADDAADQLKRVLRVAQWKWWRELAPIQRLQHFKGMRVRIFSAQDYEDGYVEKFFYELDEEVLPTLSRQGRLLDTDLNWLDNPRQLQRARCRETCRYQAAQNRTARIEQLGLNSWSDPPS